MDANVKFLLVGDSGAGKSCLVRRYTSVADVLAAAAAASDSDSDAEVASIFDASCSSDRRRFPAPTVGLDISMKVLHGPDQDGDSVGPVRKMKLFFLDTSGKPDVGDDVRLISYGPSLASGVESAAVPTALAVLIVVDAPALLGGGVCATAESAARVLSERHILPLLSSLARTSDGSIVPAASGVGESSTATFVLVGTKMDLLVGADGDAAVALLKEAFALVVAQHGLSSFLLTSSAGAVTALCTTARRRASRALGARRFRPLRLTGLMSPPQSSRGSVVWEDLPEECQQQICAKHQSKIDLYISTRPPFELALWSHA